MSELHPLSPPPAASSKPPRYVLSFRCPDRVGIVAAVAQFIAKDKGWILESQQHAEVLSNSYFMRLEIRADSLPYESEELSHRFSALADEFHMQWRISDSRRKKRVVILASRQDHCLANILTRWRSGELEMDIPCIISNHADLQTLAVWHGLPFHHVPMLDGDKSSAFQQIADFLTQARADTVVLARFMQVLPSKLCDEYAGRALNIHHGFLPSFAGARPYHQAHARGVKLIGATCHYVTPALDEGPIIEQNTVHIDHSNSVEDLVRLGKDIECTVLARALHWHLEDRVLIDGVRTVVFK